MGILDLFKKKPKPDPHVQNFRRFGRRRIVVRYSFDNPRYLHSLDFDVKAAIVDGLEAWHRVNPHLVFARSPRRARLRIRFERMSPDAAGCANFGTFPNGVIRVDLSKHDTGKDYGPKMLRDTVAHEFGHILGYNHVNGERDLMFGNYDDPHRQRGTRKAREFRVPRRLLPFPPEHRAPVWNMPKPYPVLMVKCGVSRRWHARDRMRG